MIQVTRTKLLTLSVGIVLVSIFGVHLFLESQGIEACIEENMEWLAVNERTKNSARVAYFDFGKHNDHLRSLDVKDILPICDTVRIIDSTFYANVQSDDFPFGWNKPLFRVRVFSNMFRITIHSVTIAGEESVTQEVKYVRFLMWVWKIETRILGRA